MKKLIFLLILLPLLPTFSLAQSNGSALEGTGHGDVYVNNHIADIYLNGTIKESLYLRA